MTISLSDAVELIVSNIKDIPDRVFLEPCEEWKEKAMIRLNQRIEKRMGDLNGRKI